MRSSQGETLPGTRIWCEQYGLNENVDLKWIVLNALKTSPGATIFLDDVCILQGKELYLTREQPPRGRPERPVFQRIPRRRSRSPSRTRHVQKRERSRSPLVSRRRSMSLDSITSDDAFRVRQAMPDKAGSNAVVFEAMQRRPQRATPAPTLQQSFKFQQDDSMRCSTASSLGPRQSYIQHVLERVSVAYNQVVRPELSENHNWQRALPALSKISNLRAQAQAQPAAFAPKPVREEWVEDPHFVLGVSYSAGEEEIAQAFEERIWEIDQDRMGPAGPGVDRWTSSVKMFETARRQLLGS